MPDLLGRELTVAEQSVKAALEKACATRGKLRDGSAAIRALASRAPEPFLAAGLAVIGAEGDPVARWRVYKMVADCPEFWIEMLRAERFSRQELLKLCNDLGEVDNHLDVRLARLMPGRNQENSALDTDGVMRVLDVLDELSPGTRLILLLNHLTRHSDTRIAAKATLLVGRRLRNQDWVAHHLDSHDGRVRASTVEGLWGVCSPAARDSLCASLKDKNNRVVGNALIGLHQQGEPQVNEFVKRMIEDTRPPFRWTAAWVMGKIGAQEFVEYLERARNDKEVQVRRAAERALNVILNRAAAPAADSQREPAASPQAEPATPQSETTPPAENGPPVA